MDPRAELLIDELATHPGDREFDFPYWRERFQSLFASQLDSEARERLLQAYVVVLDMVERRIGITGGDAEEFKAAREADWRALCLQEAQLRNQGRPMLPEDTHEIVQREVAAGRMAESDFTRLVADSASVLGGNRVAPNGKGFFSRLFK